MALVQCPECGKDVSSEAVGCPHCGYALVRPKKNGKAGCGFWILLGVIGIFFGLFILYSIGNNMQSERATKMRAACDPVKADVFVRHMLEDVGALYKIEERGGFPRIYVKDIWYRLSIDVKTSHDAILQCHFTRGIGDPILGVYRDYRSGKEVATTGGASGFEMK